MSSTSSLRVRLTLAFVLLSAGISLLFSYGLWSALLLTEDYMHRHRLVRERDAWLERRVRQGDHAPLPLAESLVSYLSGRDDGSIPDDVIALKPGLHELENRQELHVLVHELDDGRRLYVLLDASSTELDQFGAQITALMASLVAVMILIGGLVGRYMAGTIASPLARLRDSVVAPDSEARNLYGQRRPDEVGDVSRAFASMASRLESYGEREALFTRQVSHELRSPLTLMRNATSLLELKGDDPTFRARQLGHLTASILRMEQLIRVFLLLGREANERDLERVDLGEELASCWRDIGGGELDTAELNGLSVVIEPLVLRALFRVLLQNVCQHGKGRLTARIDTEGLHLLNPVVSTTPGEGIGWSIAERLSHRLGWTLRQECRDDVFCATLQIR